MPRHPRDYFLSDFLHVMVQGDQKKFIFSTSEQKEKFLYYMVRAASNYEVEIVAYCIMGNHAHLLVYCRNIENISKMLHQCNTTYGIFYNKSKELVGHVFRDRYKSENIDTKKYLINCIQYIHQNPVKAGICENCDEYPFSSFEAFRDGKKNYLVEDFYFTDEDMSEILQNSNVDEDFIDDDERRIDVGEIKRLIDEKRVDGILEDDDICTLYAEMKKKWKISDDKMAELLYMSRTKLRNILVKKGIK